MKTTAGSLAGNACSDQLKSDSGFSHTCITVWSSDLCEAVTDEMSGSVSIFSSGSSSTCDPCSNKLMPILKSLRTGIWVAWVSFGKAMSRSAPRGLISRRGVAYFVSSCYSHNGTHNQSRQVRRARRGSRDGIMIDIELFESPDIHFEWEGK